MQLELFKPNDKAKTESHRSPEQEAAFQLILERGRREVFEQEEIGRSIYPDFTRMIECPTDRYINICRLWHKSKGKQLETNHEAIKLDQPAKPKAPIRQWSVDAKRRKRLTELHRKMSAQYSIPELRHQAIQLKILTNPDYYGVCPLPSEFECKYYPPNLKQIQAIELENSMRAKGM